MLSSLSGSWLWQNWHQAAVMLLIALVAINFLTAFVWPALKLKVSLREVLHQLGKIKASAVNGAVDLAEVQSQAMTGARMAHLWSQYAHCLHVPWDEAAASGLVPRQQNRVKVLSGLFFSEMKAKSDGSAVDLSDIEKKVANDPRLSSLWAEYSEALDNLHKTPEPVNTRARRWRASALAETFFSEYALVDSPLKSDFYKHVPGILTGLGIIGTFAGLIVGLIHFDVSKTESMQIQLGVLVQTVGQAFFVSASAIALAMLFTWVEKTMLTARYLQVEELQHFIDGLFEAGSGQESLERLVVATEAQVAVMQDMLSELRKSSHYLAAMR